MTATPTTDRRFDVAAFRYDTTQALFDGSVRFGDIDVAMHTTSTIPEMFQQMLTDRAFDVSELGFTYYLRTLDGEAPFVALPVFPARAFRHSSVWVRSSSDITSPAQLNGRAVGEFGMYGQDAGIWAKGIMADEHGFRPETCRWVIGGLDHPQEPFSFIAQPHPAGVEVGPAPADRSLAAMLTDGVIDALFTSNVPQSVLDGSKSLRPRTHQLAERDHAQLGDDWWPYGLRANRSAIDTFLRYNHEQGITSTRWAAEDVFAPDLLDT